MAERYTTSYIISQTRKRMNDEVQPYYVDDDTLLDFINQGLEDMARALLFPTSEEYTVGAAAGEPLAVYPQEVVKPTVLVSVTDGREVAPLSRTEIEGKMFSSPWGVSDWRTLEGPPDYVITDIDLTRWRWVGIPVDDEVFKVEGYKYVPALTAVTEDIELPDHLLSSMHLCALAGAFNIEDSDAIYDPKKAGEYAQRWAAALLEMQGYHRRDKRASGGSVRYGGY